MCAKEGGEEMWRGRMSGGGREGRVVCCADIC